MKFTGERFIPGVALGGEIEIEHYQRYQAVQDLVANKTVLDAASGEGYGADILAQTAHLVCALEINRQAVSLARAKYQRPNLHFTQGSVAHLPYPNATFDRVVSFETIEHLDAGTQATFLQEIKRVLKADGLLVISTPDKLIYSDLAKYHNEFHVNEFYRQDFHNFLARQFQNIKFWEQGAVLAYLLYHGQEKSLRHILPPRVPPTGKYIIALCANVDLTAELSASVALDQDELHRQKVERVLALQDEIDEKNEHIWAWERSAQEAHARTRELDHELQQAHAETSQLQTRLTASQAEKKELQEKLTTTRAQLVHLQETRGYRILQLFYRLKNKLL